MNGSQNPADRALVAIGDILNRLGFFGLQAVSDFPPALPIYAI